MTKEQQLAERIIAAVGGMDNIDSVMNCMTRVRIKVLDENKVDDQELRHIDGVMGVIHDERIQVVVGPGTVNKVANHMAELSGVKLGDPIPPITPPSPGVAPNSLAALIPVKIAKYANIPSLMTLNTVISCVIQAPEI